jgi:hypothetical protein
VVWSVTLAQAVIHCANASACLKTLAAKWKAIVIKKRKIGLKNIYSQNGQA